MSSMVHELRTIDTTGVSRNVVVTLTRHATDAIPARWRVTCGQSESVVDSDDDTDPREALCRWAAFSLAEILAPGEPSRAELTARATAAEARVAELTAALRMYAPRCSDCGDFAPWSQHQPDIWDAVRQCDACRSST